MQKRTIIMLVLLILAGTGMPLFFWNSQEKRVPIQPEVLAAEQISTPTPRPLVRQADDTVVVDARVVPVHSAELNFGISGVPVTEIFVQEGDTVEQGAPLARLDTRELQLRIEQARATLSRAQADYDRLVAGPTAAQVARAQAQVEQAQARLRQVEGTVTDDDLAAAEARVDEARTHLQELEAGPKATEIAVAEAALNRAQINLAAQRDSLSATKTVAQSQVEQAADELRDAQTEYSQVYWEVRTLENQNADELTLQAARNREEVALRAVEIADQELEQARVVYEEARQAEITGIQAAETLVRDAQAKLDQLLAGADPDVLAAARAELADAIAALSKLQGEARAATLAAAQAELADAQARLDDLTATPPPADLARARAAIDESTVNVQQAQLDFERATLVAPLAGTIAEVNIAMGEVPVGNSAPFVIADLSEWQLETEDLTDLSIVRIRDGASALVTFYAIPGVELSGKVKQVKPLGQSAEGETIYTVTIKLDDQDDRLRWNMVGQVAIKTDL